MQSTGLDTLAVNEFIDPERWSVGEVAATTTPLPTDLDARIKEANERDSKLEEFLDVLASEYELMGINGLKDRSGLMEHRYDAL